VKVLVTYDTKFGNTQRVAELIAEGLQEAGIEVSVQNMKGVDFDAVGGYGAIFMGSPNHIRRPTGTFKKFVKTLQKLDLKDKTLVAFDTYSIGKPEDDIELKPGGSQFQVALEKMEARIRKKLPHLKLLTPGLSIAVVGQKGPILDVELAKCKEFGKTIASKL
jgi:flavodoxin